MLLKGLLALWLSVGLVGTTWAVEQEVYITADVASFGGYVFTDAVGFAISEPGKQEIGEIVVEGLYNGPYPWVMRVYTHNSNYGGIAGALRFPSSGGMVSEDGQFLIPLEVTTPNFGVGIYRTIPDISDPDYKPYSLDPDQQEAEYSDVILMGIDPRNPGWVQGPDEILFTLDDNLLGDTTIETPFSLVLRADVSPSAVKATYDTVLYFEILSAP